MIHCRERANAKEQHDQPEPAVSAVRSRAGRALDDVETTDLARVFAALGTSLAGLSAAEASSGLQQYGRNELTDKKVGDLRKFLRFFWGPIAWTIEAAGFLSLLMDTGPREDWIGEPTEILECRGSPK